MSKQSTTIVFHLACTEPRAWVVLSGTGEDRRVIEMSQPEPGVWAARAVVVPGDYRCRCYGGNARTVTYYGPPDVDGGIECGMDTLVVVGEPPDQLATPAGAHVLQVRVTV